MPRDIKKEWDKVMARMETIEQEIDDREQSLKRLSGRTARLENEWLKTHDCSCELIGIHCQHKQGTTVTR